MAAPANAPSSDDIAAALGAWDMVKGWASPTVALAALAAAFRYGYNNSKVKADLEANDKETAGIKARLEKETSTLTSRLDLVEHRQDTLGRDQTLLQVAVAALPTRTEMQAGFDSMRAEIRDARRQANSPQE